MFCDRTELTLKDKETRDLSCHESYWRKGNVIRGHTKVGTDRVERKDKRSFASEMSEEDDFGAFPDLSIADGFILLVSPGSNGV
jgi:hypothetical protein